MVDRQRRRRGLPHRRRKKRRQSPWNNIRTYQNYTPNLSLYNKINWLMYIIGPLHDEPRQLPMVPYLPRLQLEPRRDGTLDQLVPLRCMYLSNPPIDLLWFRT